MQTLKLGLKKKFQNTPIRTTEMIRVLQQFLFHYRTTPHQGTGVPPAERMFNRKLRTRLSLLLPTARKRENQTTNEVKAREFSVNDRVIGRNYYGADKWALGRVKERLGRIHYIVKLDNGKEWKRHVNQLRKVGEVPMQSQNDEEEIDYEPPENVLPEILPEIKYETQKSGRSPTPKKEIGSGNSPRKHRVGRTDHVQHRNTMANLFNSRKYRDIYIHIYIIFFLFFLSLSHCQYIK